MNLELYDEETATLIQLHDIVENDDYPFSPRIRTLREILNKLRPEPKREPPPSLSITSRRAADDTADAVGEIRTRLTDDAGECGGCFASKRVFA
jgi:hypothetical protein